MIQLKHKTGGRFAVLREPSGPIKSDSELYAAVEAHGSAVIREYVGATFDLEPKDQVLAPADFERDWRGD